MNTDCKNRAIFL